MRRAVLDTNVRVAGMRNPRGASAQLIEAAFARKFEIVANAALMIEYEAVLTRAEHMRAAGVDRATVEAALDDLAAILINAGAPWNWRPQLSDPNDEMVLAAAVNGLADAIVTFERSVFRPAAGFGLAVMTPTAFWGKGF
jgi:putative PIN family toxin of toxin-antitoxin system